MAAMKLTCSEPGCGRPHEARGVCKLHYHRLLRSGLPGPVARVPPEDRFWSCLAPPDENGCRRWLGTITDRGYGQISIGPRGSAKILKAHAYGWQITYHGPVRPDFKEGRGATYRHICDHPWCAEPAHVYPGTQLDNIADKMAKGRHATGKGERHGSKTHPESRPRGDQHWTRRRAGALT